jgi:biotin carboxylase
MSLVEAARHRCTIVWVVDTSDPEVASMERLLQRVGTCVDVAGMDRESAIAAVAQHRPNALLALADDCLVFAADLAHGLGLSFTSPEVARRYTDKHEQRRAFALAGLDVPRQWVVDPADPTIFSEIQHQARFPAVLKPRRGEASRDTLPVASFEELISLWRSEGFASSSQVFVLEEYIPDSDTPVCGDGFAGYVSVESVVSNEVVSHLAVNGRMPPAFPFRETGFFIPAALSEDLSATIFEVAERAAHALGVVNGCLHTEIKMTPTGPVVIEVNGRIGGGVPEMLQAATGIDLLGLAFDLALGNDVVLATPSARCLAYLFYVQPPSAMSRVLAVEGLDELRSTPGVTEVTLNRGPGHEVSWRYGNHGHVFSVFGTCADHEELRRMNTLISQSVRIVGT